MKFFIETLSVAGAWKIESVFLANVSRNVSQFVKGTSYISGSNARFYFWQTNQLPIEGVTDVQSGTI